MNDIKNRFCGTQSMINDDIFGVTAYTIEISLRISDYISSTSFKRKNTDVVVVYTTEMTFVRRRTGNRYKRGMKIRVVAVNVFSFFLFFFIKILNGPTPTPVVWASGGMTSYERRKLRHTRRSSGR